MMNPIRLLAISLIVLATTANAATFEKASTVKSVSLSKVVKAFKDAVDGQEDTGASSATIVAKSKSEKWVNTVKQYLHTLGRDEVITASEKKLDSLDAQKEVRRLMEEMPVAKDIKGTDEEKALIEAINGLTGKKLVFTGSISGSNLSYRHITFVDVTRMEIVSIYAGTSD